MLTNKSLGFSYEDWITLLESCESPNDRAFTRAQWEKRLNRGQNATLKWLKNGMDNGLIGLCFVKEKSMTGITVPKPAYYLIHEQDNKTTSKARKNKNGMDKTK